MPVPDRPVDDAEIATDWGQDIHDRVFAPAGCEVRSSAGVACGTTEAGLNLDTVTEDPGGYLDAANDRIEVPTGREGLYHIFIQGDSVNGTASTDQTRIRLLINNATQASGLEDNAGAVHVIPTVTWVGVLAAGDQLRCSGQKRGSGTNPTVSITSFFMYRVGAELGA